MNTLTNYHSLDPKDEMELLMTSEIGSLNDHNNNWAMEMATNYNEKIPGLCMMCNVNHYYNFIIIIIIIINIIFIIIIIIIITISISFFF